MNTTVHVEIKYLLNKERIIYNDVKNTYYNNLMEMKKLKSTMTDFFDIWYSLPKDDKMKETLLSTKRYLCNQLSSIRSENKTLNIELLILKNKIKKFQNILSEI